MKIMISIYVTKVEIFSRIPQKLQIKILGTLPKSLSSLTIDVQTFYFSWTYFSRQ